MVRIQAFKLTMKYFFVEQSTYSKSLWNFNHKHFIIIKVFTELENNIAISKIRFILAKMRDTQNIHKISTFNEYFKIILVIN